MLQPYEFIGLAGVACGLYAYGRVQWRRDYAKTLSYSLFNVLNAILLEISLLHDWNLSSFIGNAIWLAFSLYGVVRCLKYIRRAARLKRQAVPA